jgi:hypothetical protein
MWSQVPYDVHKTMVDDEEFVPYLQDNSFVSK